MVDKFYSFEKACSIIPIRKVRSAIWYVLKYCLNRYAPRYYHIHKRTKGIPASKYVDKEVIISLTTFPARMKTLPVVLESIFRQSVAADRVILWLADSQYPNKKEVSISLSKYIEYGLEIRYCEDLRSHKKYFFSMKEFPDSLIVTFDDDIFCPENMLERVLLTYKAHPDCIVSQRAHKFRFDANGELLPYGQCNNLARDCAEPSLNYIITGGAGCLYFPGSLSEHVFDKDVLKDKCFLADDIWLTCMAYIKGTKVVLTGKNNPEIIDVEDNKNNGLAIENVINDKNDIQLKAVTNYYNIKWVKDNE